MLRQRLLVAAIGIPLLLLVLLAGSPWIELLLVLLITAAAVEMAGLLDRAGYPVQPALAGVLALVIAARSALPSIEILLGVVLVAAIFAAAVAELRPDPVVGLQRLSGTVLTTTAAALLGALLLIVTGAVSSATTGPLKQWLDDGRVLLLVVVLTVWAYDTAAYAVGRLFPRGHFFAHISPNKTWSGAIGGLVGAALVGYAMGALIGRPIEGFGLGIIVGVVAPVGDLAESMLKRAAGVKDSSRLFPGHGGVLDRMDSFLAVAPVAWLYFVLVGLAS